MKRRALEAPPLCKKTLSYIQETRNHHPTKLGSFLPKTNWQTPSLHKIFSITTNTKPCPPQDSTAKARHAKRELPSLVPHNIFGTTSSQKGIAISQKIQCPLRFLLFRSPITEKDIETMKKRKEGDSGGRGPLGEKEEKRRARHKEQRKGTPLFFALHCSPHPVLSSPHPLSLSLLLSLPPCISPFLLSPSVLLSFLLVGC